MHVSGGAVASDVRTWHMRHVKSSGVGATVRMLYPRMLAVHLFPDEVGFPDETGRLVMPQAIRCSYARMEPHGAYLVGTSLSPSIKVDDTRVIDSGFVSSPAQRTARRRSFGSDRPCRPRSYRTSTLSRTSTS